MKLALAAALVAGVAIDGWAQDNTTQIVTRSPTEVTVAVNEWTTVAVINPHDGFGRSYETGSGEPPSPGSAPSVYTTSNLCELNQHTWDNGTCVASDAGDYDDPEPCGGAGYYWWSGAIGCREEVENEENCDEYASNVNDIFEWRNGQCEEVGDLRGEFTLMLSLTGFPNLSMKGSWNIQMTGRDYADKEIRLRVRKYDHRNAAPSMFDQEGNFEGARVHALCREGVDVFGNCHGVSWPANSQSSLWPNHQKIKYWERSGADPNTTYYVEGPFLVQVLVENGCYLEGVIRIQYDGYTDVVGGGDRRQVVEYSEVVVRGAGPAPNH